MNFFRDLNVCLKIVDSRVPRCFRGWINLNLNLDHPPHRCLGRVRKRHPSMFYLCLIHGASIREKDRIPFGWCFWTQLWQIDSLAPINRYLANRRPRYLKQMMRFHAYRQLLHTSVMRVAYPSNTGSSNTLIVSNARSAISSTSIQDLLWICARDQQLQCVLLKKEIKTHFELFLARKIGFSSASVLVVVKSNTLSHPVEEEVCIKGLWSIVGLR